MYWKIRLGIWSQSQFWIDHTALCACEHTRHIYTVVILQGRKRAKKGKDLPLTDLVCHSVLHWQGGLRSRCSVQQASLSEQKSGSEQEAELEIMFLDLAVTFSAFILYQDKWACEVSHCPLKQKQEESLRTLSPVPVMIWWPRCFNFTWLWDIQVTPLQKRCALLQVNFHSIIAFLSHLH